MTPRLLAISVPQPWAWAVTCLGANTITLGHKLPEWVVGCYVAVCSGSHLGFGSSTAAWLHRAFGVYPDEALAYRSVVAVARVRGVDQVPAVRGPTPADPWGFGPWCLRLGRAVPIEPVPRQAPVPVRGLRSLHELSPAVVELVRQRYRHALPLAHASRRGLELPVGPARASAELEWSRRQRPALFRQVALTRADGAQLALASDGTPRRCGCHQQMTLCPACRGAFCDNPAHGEAGRCKHPPYPHQGDTCRRNPKSSSPTIQDCAVPRSPSAV